MFQDLTSSSPPLDRVGDVLPRFGMGTAAIGNLYRAIDDATADATVAAALDAGVRYFDTAPHYGFGLAERRLGAALAQRDPRRTCQISTKVGRLLTPTDAAGARHGFVDADPFEPVFDYTADGVARSFEASCARLGRDRVDVLLAHDLGRLTHGEAHERHLRDFLDGGYAAMVALRDAGTVGAIGVGVNEVAVCEELLDRVPLDVILLAGRYTLLDRSAKPFLDRCAAQGVRVIIGGAYNSGILARDPHEQDPAQSHYDYAAPPAALVERTRALARTCATAGVSLPAAAIQFPLRHPAVACVLAGLGSPQEVADLRARIDAPIADDLWPTLEARAPQQLILLHPDDNVMICVAPIAAGDLLPVSGGTIPAREGVTVGHKIARAELKPGDKVIKYGAPIGSMTDAAAAGQWVHMHNMKSDYIASHTRSTVTEQRA
ncbi:D-threo-aldose 1-dehydrogenase [Sphingomonas endophytica]|uniref:D-threo-aldose 1-dehydrogenase n=1 Tax=Sphingomonas endophytica TaxID=869719 RepID=A0A7X0JBC9_9SPHN|nr:aldo/keto reductase [Sphingomonas endophytica]MBB6503487.1 D-threo-aldose 1-dehydrogenase [Sphingomonas endophytica]